MGKERPDVSMRKGMRWVRLAMSKLILCMHVLFEFVCFCACSRVSLGARLRLCVAIVRANCSLHGGMKFFFREAKLNSVLNSLSSAQFLSALKDESKEEFEERQLAMWPSPCHKQAFSPPPPSVLSRVSHG